MRLILDYMLEEGYVYILSNPAFKSKVYKVGRTLKLPENRARQLSNHSGVPKDFNVEWSKKVPNTVLAEHMLHYILSRVSYGKEYFFLPLDIAINICEESLDRLFKPLRSSITAKNILIEHEMELASTELEKELKRMTEGKKKSKKEFFIIDEEKTGISTIPLGEKNTSWEKVIPLLQYSFGKVAVNACLDEGKDGDPIRRRFISFRSNYNGMKRIDLSFRQKYLVVGITTDKVIQGKNLIKNEFKNQFLQLEASNWEYGFTFKISTEKQFKILSKFLKIKSVSHRLL